MWTVMLKFFREINGIEISEEINYVYDSKSDALIAVEFLTNQMKFCRERYTITISFETPKPFTKEEVPVDWK